MPEKQIITEKEMHSLSNYFRQGIYSSMYAFFKYLDFPLLNYVRFLILKLFAKKIQSSYISDGVHVWFPWNLSIGKQSSLNKGVILNAAGNITIGNYVRIAAYVVLNSVDHVFSNSKKSIKDQGFEKAPIIIEDDVWIGANVTINKGVTIGEGSIIGAGSVVTKNIPPFSVAVGVPAKVVKHRD